MGRAAAMLSAAGVSVPQAAVDAVKSYLRLAGSEEDALVSACAGSAIELCEGFTRTAVLVRAHEERLAVSGGWVRLGAVPVRAITGVEAVAADGTASAIPGGAYMIDIDAHGCGWVRVASGGPARVRVSYQAGLASDWAGLPEALRHGIVRLAAHLFSERDTAGAAPPAAVSALWRPWRRMNLGGRDVRTA